MNIPNRMRVGSTLLLVLFLASIAGIAVMTFFNTVRRERGRAARVLQRTRGQAIARRVVMRIAALVQQKPWSERFFKEKPVRIYSSEGAFKEDGVEFKAGSVHYEGEVKQLSALNKWFRIKLRVVLPSGSFATKDYAYNSAWDLRYSEGILGAMNRCNVLASAETDDIDAPEDQLDQELDFIKNIARSPEKDPQIAGTDGKPWMDDVRGSEGKGEDTKTTDLVRPPTDLLNPPPWVDGQSEDPIKEVEGWINEALGGPPVAATPPPPTPTPTVVASAPPPSPTPEPTPSPTQVASAPPPSPTPTPTPTQVASAPPSSPPPPPSDPPTPTPTPTESASAPPTPPPEPPTASGPWDLFRFPPGTIVKLPDGRYAVALVRSDNSKGINIDIPKDKWPPGATNALPMDAADIEGTSGATGLTSDQDIIWWSYCDPPK